MQNVTHILEIGEKRDIKEKNSHIWTLDLIQIYFDKYSLSFDAGVL